MGLRTSKLVMSALALGLLVAGIHLAASATLGAVVVCVLLALFAVMARDRLVLGPITRLLHAFAQLESGRTPEAQRGARGALGRLGEAFDRMAGAIAQRERSLREASQRARCLLDAIGDAVITCNLEGELQADASALAVEWFGPPRGRLWDYLFAQADDESRAALSSDLEQLRNDFLPFHLLVQQMPQRFERAGRSFAIRYRLISGETGEPQLLVVVRDESDQVRAERSAQETAQLQLSPADRGQTPAQLAVTALRARLAGLVDVPTALSRVGEDVDLLRELLDCFAAEFAHSAHEIRAALPAGDIERIRRIAHTIKGAAGNLSALEVASAAGELELAAARADHASLAALTRRLAAALDALHAAIGPLSRLPSWHVPA
jgi:HPt (histidine-containing phosphotransfer) domain-containing protein